MRAATHRINSGRHVFCLALSIFAISARDTRAAAEPPAPGIDDLRVVPIELALPDNVFPPSQIALAEHFADVPHQIACVLIADWPALVRRAGFQQMLPLKSFVYRFPEVASTLSEPQQRMMRSDAWIGDHRVVYNARFIRPIEPALRAAELDAPRDYELLSFVAASSEDARLLGQWLATQLRTVWTKQLADAEARLGRAEQELAALRERPEKNPIELGEAKAAYDELIGAYGEAELKGLTKDADQLRAMLRPIRIELAGTTERVAAVRRLVDEQLVISGGLRNESVRALEQLLPPLIVEIAGLEAKKTLIEKQLADARRYESLGGSIRRLGSELDRLPDVIAGYERTIRELRSQIDECRTRLEAPMFLKNSIILAPIAERQPPTTRGAAQP